MWSNCRRMGAYLFLLAMFVAICQSQNTTKHEVISTTPVHNVTTELPKPNVTTVEPPTTPAPGPKKQDSPPVIKYNITAVDKNETYICFMANLAVQFEITYNNTKNKEEKAYLSIENGTVVKGESKCGENKTILVIKINEDKDDTLTMEIKREDGKYFVDKIDLKLDGKTVRDMMPDAPAKLEQIEAKVSNSSLFEAPKDKSYKCNAQVTEAMDSQNSVSVKMIVKDVQFDAFREKESKDTFRTAKRCSADEEINDVIPIAVGAALGALVIIVLIAYFIGRRRSRRLAYQSV